MVWSGCPWAGVRSRARSSRRRCLKLRSAGATRAASGIEVAVWLVSVVGVPEVRSTTTISPYPVRSATAQAARSDRGHRQPGDDLVARPEKWLGFRVALEVDPVDAGAAVVPGAEQQRGTVGSGLREATRVAGPAGHDIAIQREGEVRDHLPVWVDPQQLEVADYDIGSADHQQVVTVGGPLSEGGKTAGEADRREVALPVGAVRVDQVGLVTARDVRAVGERPGDDDLAAVRVPGRTAEVAVDVGELAARPVTTSRTCS